ncbi:unnamed protein product [Gulo gulo]|uniref:Uncharacterized protein n=1 Tax=Gulo gulo TaxID=48420 RepID=A0A9X9Q7I4_GULGU|nr:unnamed protein product [Gulo gulo]
MTDNSWVRSSCKPLHPRLPTPPPTMSEKWLSNYSVI